MGEFVGSSEDLEGILHDEQRLEREREEEEPKEMVIKWEKFLPRRFLRVLLVEVDDSTRQIIGALLRKCSYKVAAVSNGLKAWEILKEKPHSFDLVLTEVALPVLSGFGLLTMMMEHDICKNIPVIMMSSHDSMGVVFKCMLKGAVDYLVKPIRKNELRNLWQHVWRRHSSIGGRNGSHDGNCSQKKIEVVSENNAASNRSSEYNACVQKNKESSGKGSDALSSCTKPDTEAESTYPQDVQELLQPQHRCSSQDLDQKSHMYEDCVELDGASLMHGSEAEDKQKRLGSEAIPCNETEEFACTKVVGAEENVAPTSCREGATNDCNYKQIKHPTVAIDLIGAMDNTPCCSYADKCDISFGETIINRAGQLSDVKENTCKLSTSPLWELSLRRSQINGHKDQEIEERQILNHSNASAFSRYNNKTVLPFFPTLTSFSTAPIECASTSRAPVSHGTSDSGGALKWMTMVAPSGNNDDNESPVVGPGKDETSFPCHRFGIIPVSVPMGGITVDGLCAGYGAVMPPIFYPQPGHPLWNSSSTNHEEAVPVNSSNQSDQTPETHSPKQNHHLYDHTANQPAVYQAITKRDDGFEQAEDQRNTSSATGQSVSSSLCNGNRSHLNSTGCGSVCNGSSGNINASTVAGATEESASEEGLLGQDGTRVMDYHRLTQREAALNKFRMKRKDRCFEKKVRYQSRKRLAEQRPRVKGQFVRQVQPESTAMETDCYYRCDSMAA